jgi:folate-binding protein YgfZ
MQQLHFHFAKDRSVIQVSGADRQSFLQGLISNDTRKIAADRAVYSALLTPQGRFLFDLFVAEHQGAYLIDCEAARRQDLLRRLSLYRLRAKVSLSDMGASWRVCILHGSGALSASHLPHELGAAVPFHGGTAFVDPRLLALGVRALLPGEGAEGAMQELGAERDVDGARYNHLRASIGVPAAPVDLVPEKSLLLESGLDELNAIDWDKGCYMGQELTARSKYRGLVRKRLFPVEIIGPAPAPGAALVLGGKEVGEMRGVVASAGLGLALIRLEAFAGEANPVLHCGGTEIRPRQPSWMLLPAAEAGSAQ